MAAIGDFRELDLVDVRRPRTRMPDMTITVLAIVLATSGVVVSGSARVFHEAVGGGMPLGILRSLLHLALALGAMALTMLPDYRRMASRDSAWVLLLGVTALLIGAFFTPEVGNTHRWIRVFGISLQPSELAKVVLIVVVAATLCRAGEQVRQWSGLTRPLVLAGWMAALVLLAKDLGTPVLMFATTLVLCFVAGARPKHLAALLAAGALLAALAVLIEPYRVGRVLGFVNGLDIDSVMKESVPYQLRQSLIAIGSGGTLGKGLGLSTQKAFFLPEADNDFIYSVIVEELGLLGGLAVLAAFLVLGWRGLRVAERAPDPLGKLIAVGATFFLCGQALCHMGVVIGILPTKGLTLPFFSTGGSSLIGSCAIAGLLMNVSLRRRAHGTY